MKENINFDEKLEWNFK